MKVVRCLLLVAGIICGVISQSFTQLVIPGDFADPSVVYVDGTYYAVGTSSEWAPHFPIFSSKDMIEWSQVGYAFYKKPSWTMSSFWAPELVYRNGKFYLYYTARRASDKVSCVGVATADKIEDGFTDHGVLIEHGSEAIDGFLVEDKDGLYMTWKAYGLDKRPIELLAAKMSDDGLKITGEPFTLMMDSSRRGLEGQCIIKHDGYFYLFYSVGGCCGAKCSYAVNVARSTSLRGPYINYQHNPMLSENDQWRCFGHGTLVQSPDSTWYYLLHAYNKSSDIYTGRQGMLRKMKWNGEWPQFSEVPVQEKNTEFVDNFDGDKLSYNWQWDFRHAQPVSSVNNNELCLSGELDSTKNPTGNVIAVRPFSADFEMSVKVNNTNAALKGLAFYGDASAAVGIGVRDNIVEVWQIKDSSRNVVWSATLPKKQIPVELKLKAEKGQNLQFSFRNGSNNWKAAGKSINAGFLPQWDRAPRPGLHHRGNADQPACFSQFRIAQIYR